VPPAVSFFSFLPEQSAPIIFNVLNKAEICMKDLYKRFWFEFEIDTAFNYPPGIGRGCGVTAFNYEDAVMILDEKVFTRISRPSFKAVVENVDIRLLDQGHVIPNMKPPIYRGVWFPLGYD